jgi:predicted MFS family arabinose efflux permease
VTTLAPPTTARARRGGLFAQRDFRLLWIGETASALGSSVTSVALPLIALDVLHSGVVTISLLTAVAWLPWLVIGLPAGAWVDRLARRPLMMTCDAVSIALFASVPVAVWFGVLSTAQLLLVALLSGVAKVFFATAYRAYLPALVAPDDLVAGNARLQGAESAAQIGGPSLGGALAQLCGAATGLLADAASFAVSLLCLRRIRAVEPAQERRRRALRAEIAEGARFVRRDPLLLVLTLFGGAANFVLTGYNAILVAFLVRGVGLGAGAAGLLVALGGVGGVLGALVAPAISRALGSARALLVLKLSGPLFSLLIPFAARGPRLGIAAIGLVGMTFCIVGNNVINGGFVQRYCPAHLLGRVSTSIQVINFGAMPLGALAGGLLAEALGFRPALWLLLGGFVAVSTMLLSAPLRTLRDLPVRAGST